MISRLCLLSLLACAVCRASDNPSEILRRIDAKAISHLAKAVNYTCVETVQRLYFGSPKAPRQTCPAPEAAQRGKLFASDRLRLDVAVGRGTEMYSWHADHKFSSTLIDSVVQSGPTGSGGFVGFLNNVFGQRGVKFYFHGREMEGTAEVFSFTYVVPLAASRYSIHSGKAEKTVAFHGSFSAYTDSYELAGMTVIADNIPKNLDICSTRNVVSYQLAPVAGNLLLLPRVWTLNLAAPSMSTESDIEYTACREFAGESKILYKDLATAGSANNAEPAPEPQVLPAGITLHIRLRTPIDGQHSYAGDLVRGELLNSIRAGKHRKRIPRGAVLKGVITRLEDYYDRPAHYLLDIEFEDMRSGARTFLLRAQPKPLPSRRDELQWMYGSWAAAPRSLDEAVKQGLFVFPSKRLHLDENFSSYWETVPLTALR